MEDKTQLLNALVNAILKLTSQCIFLLHRRILEEGSSSKKIWERDSCTTVQNRVIASYFITPVAPPGTLDGALARSVPRRAGNIRAYMDGRPYACGQDHECCLPKEDPRSRHLRLRPYCRMPAGWVGAVQLEQACALTPSLALHSTRQLSAEPKKIARDVAANGAGEREAGGGGRGERAEL